MPVSKEELEKSSFSIVRQWMDIVDRKDKLIKDLRIMIAKRDAKIAELKKGLLNYKKEDAGIF